MRQAIEPVQEAEHVGRRALEALYLADEHLYRHLDLDQVLQSLVNVVIDILEADKSAVMVWHPERERLEVRASRGFCEKALALMSYRSGEGVAGRVFATGEPAVVEDFELDTSVAHQIAQIEGIRSMLSVPITIGNKVFGVFGMNYCAPRTFTAEEQRVFLSLAHRAALAIENARLYQQAREAAALEERRRLARELHDSVTQSLYSVTLLAEAGRRLAHAGQVEPLEGYLTRLGETAQQALKEMRLLVYQLRPLVLEREGLISALQQRLEAVEKRAGVQARLLAEDNHGLPAQVEDELYRIATEALNNTLKHAHATSVTVRLIVREQVELSVIDNGCGFEPDDAQSHSGIGLSSMRERVARLGGVLRLRSAAGGGTEVRVTVPARQEEGSCEANHE
jgi:signal transduction histidine kinase